MVLVFFVHFVHMSHSQQILSQVWYGNVPWQDRNLLYKVFHIIMLTLVAPLSALILFFYKMNGSAKSEQCCQLPEELPKTITVLLQNGTAD